MFYLEAVGVIDYSNIVKLPELFLTSGTGFSHMKRKNNYRTQLVEESLSCLTRIIMDGKLYAHHDSTKAVEDFLQQKYWKKTCAERKRSGDQ